MRHNPGMHLGQAPGNGGVVTADGSFNIGGRRYIGKDFYSYIVEVATLAASGVATQQLNIQADADFIWQKATYFATIADAAQTDSSRVIPVATVQITDTSSGRELQSQAVGISAIFGTGELPYILPTPRLFPARSTQKFQFANLDSANAYRIQLVLSGYKAYPQT